MHGQQNVKKLCVCVCVCVFVALGIQHAMYIRHTVICGLLRRKVFFHIISLTVRFSKKKLPITKCVFSQSVQLLSETLLILRTNE